MKALLAPLSSQGESVTTRCYDYRYGDTNERLFLAVDGRD